MSISETKTAIKRCEHVIKTISHLPLPSTITHTLLKLASSELSFLSSLPTDSLKSNSTNISHVESVTRLLQLPSVNSVSRVCKPIPLLNGVYVDIVCTIRNLPVWIIVSDRNPKYITWNESNKGLKTRIDSILVAAESTTTLKPSSLIVFFANGLNPSIYDKLKNEYRAKDFDFGFDGFDYEEMVDGEWINVVRKRSYKEAVSIEIKVVDDRSEILLREVVQEDGFSCVMRLMRGEEDGVVNFDTTALVAFVSGISNGCAERIVGTSEVELEERFKGNTVFVVAQAKSEIEDSVLVKMGSVLSGKRGVVCESVVSEFKELVEMYAGPNEKRRAEHLLKSLMVVNDGPSERVMALPTTRKLAMKNKIVFGTGDRWRSPTLTANMGFVRAVAQFGMSLSTIDHSPRALTGD